MPRPTRSYRIVVRNANIARGLRRYQSYHSPLGGALLPSSGLVQSPFSDLRDADERGESPLVRLARLAGNMLNRPVLETSQETTCTKPLRGRRANLTVKAHRNNRILQPQECQLRRETSRLSGMASGELRPSR